MGFCPDRAPVSDSALLAHDRARGVRLVAGVDEVGRACWAGPIMAAVVLFDLERLVSGAGTDLDELTTRSACRKPSASDSQRPSSHTRRRSRSSPSLRARSTGPDSK